MARPIVLSNGELHVGINTYGMVHDFYFPYVGFENHSAGKDTRHKVGVWCDGQISWLDDSDWQITQQIASGALIGHTKAWNEQLEILLEFDDFITTHTNAFIRNIHVVNLKSEERDIRLFMHQAFAIGDSRSNTDTAQYLPDSDAVLHYRGRRAFIIGGKTAHGLPFDQHSIGLFGIEGREGTYRDADDGNLSGSNVEHGRVDSTIRFQLLVPGHESRRVSYWIAAGTSMREALMVHRQMQEKDTSYHLAQTVNWWDEWLQPVYVTADKLPTKYRELFIHSALVIKAHIDKRGAVIASSDTSMLNYSRDAYAYCWPRDGAYALWPLMRLGYEAEARQFFEFCRRGLHPNGYLMHKYRADGALGSSWHPYVHGTESAPPIQEDETALTLFMFAQYYHQQEDKALLDEFYDSMVRPMADFMASYVDQLTGLPRPSYDLWEEKFLTTTYTTAVVQASLAAAAELAEIMDDGDNAVKWRTASDDMIVAAHKYLYNHKREAFYKGLIVKNDQIEFDETIDVSSFYGVYMFGLFSSRSEEVTQMYQTLTDTFHLSDKSPGLPRYEYDEYHRIDTHSLGNTWVITSLWLAQYSLEVHDQPQAMAILDWLDRNVGAANMLAEQIDPSSGAPLSVSPLVWSHAEYMATLLDLTMEQSS